MNNTAQQLLSTISSVTVESTLFVYLTSIGDVKSVLMSSDETIYSLREQTFYHTYFGVSLVSCDN